MPLNPLTSPSASALVPVRKAMRVSDCAIVESTSLKLRPLAAAEPKPR